jgi:glycosyltransferase involved in cell wall biosynthesis
VVHHGFISKASVEDRVRMEALFRNAHFFILPTRAEAYGVVYCEANSFGLPAIGTKTGGVPTIIRDGRNGKTFSLEAPADEYARYVMETFNDWNGYCGLAAASFEEYTNRLNWETAGRTMIQWLKQL